MKPALVFIGFMGAGKSTALAAARDAGLEAAEIDALIEEKASGCRSAEFFDEFGEDAFRALEEEVVGGRPSAPPTAARSRLAAAASSPSGVREALGRHVVVWLQVDAREAWRRIARSDRPLASNAEDVERLLEQRHPFYEPLADAVIPPGDRGLISRAMPSLLALCELPSGTKMLWAASTSGEYPVFAGPGLLGVGPWPLARAALLHHR